MLMDIVVKVKHTKAITGVVRGERLKYHRQQLRLSQAALADLTGVDQTLISDYENSIGNPTALTIKALAKGLGITTSYLLGESDEAMGLITDGSISDYEREVITAIRHGDKIAAAQLVLSGQ